MTIYDPIHKNFEGKPTSTGYYKLPSSGICDFTKSRGDERRLNMRKFLENPDKEPRKEATAQEILDITACYAPKLHVILTSIRDILEDDTMKFKNIAIHVPMLRETAHQNFTLTFYALCLAKYLTQMTAYNLKIWNTMTDGEKEAFDHQADSNQKVGAVFGLYAGHERKSEADAWEKHTGLTTANICLISKAYEAGTDVNKVGHMYIVYPDNASLKDQQIGRMVRRLALRRIQPPPLRDEDYPFPWQHVVYHVMYPSNVRSALKTRLNCDYLYAAMWNSFRHMFAKHRRFSYTFIMDINIPVM